MHTTDLRIYDNESTITISNQRCALALQELREGNRELSLPSHFRNEMEAIVFELEEFLKPSFFEFIKSGLSLSVSSVIYCVTIMFVQTQFGPIYVTGYHSFSSLSMLTDSIIKTYSETTTPGPLRNTSFKKKNLLRTSQLIFSRFISNLNNAFRKYFPLENMLFSDISGASQAPLLQIFPAYVDYMKALDEQRFIEAMQGPITFPAKTCFTKDAHHNYITTILDQRLLVHFKNALRRFARVVAEEMPVEITNTKSLSWISKSLDAVRRLVEPIVIPYQIITKQGIYNPHYETIVDTSRSIQFDIRENQRDTIINKQLQKSQLSWAHDLYKVHQNSNELQDQSQLISKQEAEIARLRAELASRDTTSLPSTPPIATPISSSDLPFAQSTITPTQPTESLEQDDNYGQPSLFSERSGLRL